MQAIPLNKRLEPYFKIAAEVAKESECVRRQYGSVIVLNDTSIYHLTACNQRITRCCNGVCARDRFQTKHGQRVEVGAEIHSETAALIKKSIPTKDTHFILVGFENGHELLGNSVYPCHSCAMALKFAGYDYIYIKSKDKEIVPVSVSEILEYREEEWEPDI